MISEPVPISNITLERRNGPMTRNLHQLPHGRAAQGGSGEEPGAKAMPRDGSVLNTCPARRRLDEAIDRMRSHALVQYDRRLSVSVQDPVRTQVRTIVRERDEATVSGC